MSTESAGVMVAETADVGNVVVERLAWVWFSCLPAVRALPKGALLQLAGSPQHLMGLDAAAMTAIGIRPPETQALLLSQKYRELACASVQRADEAALGILYPAHPDYPELLREIVDCPYALFWKGKLLPWKSAQAKPVAIVGSRRSTGYGVTMATRLSADLAALGPPIVSGLARGIDTAAHTGALQAEGMTIAVLGNGLDADLAGIYPPENRNLAERVMASGCLLSEFIPGLPPAAYHFPMRNRIISGLSSGVIVVEAGVRSGSLITVGTALEQNRDVMAVPGNATSTCSQGCNQLIREGAMLVQQVADVEEMLNGIHPRLEDGMMETAKHTARTISRRMAGSAFPEEVPLQGSPQRRVPPGKTSKSKVLANRQGTRVSGLTLPERMIHERLRRETLTADELCGQTGLTVPELQEGLLKLELAGLVAQGMDGRFQLMA
jgi:DNA processing protein